MNRPHRKLSVIFRSLSVFQTIVLTAFLVIPPQVVQAQSFNVLTLPAPGTMVTVSEKFTPALLRGISLHPENPLVFDFIVDPGYSNLKDDGLRDEGERLIKYFLAALTVPEKDLWVNLSPYEKDRIIPSSFGQTEMGRDLLAQDYLLKQISASLIYPEDDLGKDFWGKVYKKAKEVYGTDRIPVSTFNKVWIVPDSAVVVESESSAYVARAHLKVMLEEDMAALDGNRAAEILGAKNVKGSDLTKVNNISSNVVREIILPQIEKEVNEGKNFAQLRQLYYSLILATWFKKNLKDNIINEVYSNQGKVAGVDLKDETDQEKIYEQYMEAYQKGVFNYIRKDVDGTTRETIQRKYFSGGAKFNQVDQSSRFVRQQDLSQAMQSGQVSPSDLAPTQTPYRMTASLREVDSSSGNREPARISERNSSVRTPSEMRTNMREFVRTSETLFSSNPSSFQNSNSTVTQGLKQAITSDDRDVQRTAARVITSLPAEIRTASFTPQEIELAHAQTLRQLGDSNQPEIQMLAAQSVIGGKVQDFIDNVPAIDFARRVVEQRLQSITQKAPETVRPLTMPQVQALELSLTDATVKPEAVTASAPVLRDLLQSNNIQLREASERIVTSLPSEIRQASFTPEEIARATDGTLRQLQDSKRPDVRVLAAKAVQSGGVQQVVNKIPAIELAKQVIVEQPLAMVKEASSSFAKPVMLPQMQMFETSLNASSVTSSAKKEMLTGVAPVISEGLKSNNKQEREISERIVMSLPSEIRQASFTPQEIAQANTSVLRQLQDVNTPEVQVLAAQAVKSGGIQEFVSEMPAVEYAQQVIVEQSSALVKDASNRPLTTPQMRMLETSLNTAQTPVAKKEAVTSASSALKTGLANAANHEVQMTAQRIITSLPQDVREVSFTPVEIKQAKAGTLEQMQDKSRPEAQVLAALAVASGEVRDVINEIPALEVAQRVIIEQPLAMAKAVSSTINRPLTLPQAQILEISLTRTPMAPVVQAEAVTAAAPALKVGLNSNDVQVREASERIVMSLPSAIRQASFTPQEVTQANTGTLRQLQDVNRPEVRVLAAQAVTSGQVQGVIGQMPAMEFARQVIAQQPLAVAQQTRPSSKLEVTERMMPQLSVSKQAEVLQSVVPSLQSKSSTERETAQRMIAAAPQQVRELAKLTEDQIQGALTGVQLQLEKPETALPAALALKTAGQSDTKVEAVISKNLSDINDLGGIDFNPSQIKMEITKENGGIKVKFDPKVLEEIRSKGVKGFVPVILNVQPISNVMPLIMGESQKEDRLQFAQL